MRLFRRLGGAVRGVIAEGAALANRLRSRTGQKTQRQKPPVQDAAKPAAPRPPRRPRAAAPAPAAPQPTATAEPSTRQGWFTRWFGRRPSQPAASAGSEKPARQPRARRKKYPLFTPQTHPGLTAEDCEFLNTPIGECDPEKLRGLADALSHQIAAMMGPNLGMDADALFATFCERLFLTQTTAAPEVPADAAEPVIGTASAEQPEQESSAPDDAAPANTPVPPSPAPAAEATPSADNPAASPAEFAFQRQGGVAAVRWPATPSRRPVSRRGRTTALCRVHGKKRENLPARRLCYAACAGPP